MRWIGHVHADVVFEQLRHEAARRAAHRNGQLHHLGAVGIRLERALDRLDLAAQPADTLLQLGLLMNRVSHMRRRSIGWGV